MLAGGTVVLDIVQPIVYVSTTCSLVRHKNMLTKQSERLQCGTSFMTVECWILQSVGCSAKQLKKVEVVNDALVQM